MLYQCYSSGEKDAQPSVRLHILLSQDNFKALSNSHILVSRKPPNSLTFSSILYLNFCGLSPQKTFWTFFLFFFMVESFGLGRENRMCVILDSIKLYTNMIIIVMFSDPNNVTGFAWQFLQELAPWMSTYMK